MVRCTYTDRSCLTPSKCSTCCCLLSKVKSNFCIYLQLCYELFIAYCSNNSLYFMHYMYKFRLYHILIISITNIIRTLALPFKRFMLN
nr:MAG TPA: hypothetical protein [Caudoviricetes sp.]